MSTTNSSQALSSSIATNPQASSSLGTSAASSSIAVSSGTVSSAAQGSSGATVPTVSTNEAPHTYSANFPSEWPTWCKQAGRCGIITDTRDGHTYRFIYAGGHYWTAENAAYKTSWGSYCYADQDSNCAKYGRLYLEDVAYAQACPTHWRVANQTDMTALEDSLTHGALPASMMFKAPYYSSKDSIGFSALPGGFRVGGNTGAYEGAGQVGMWWYNGQGYIYDFTVPDAAPWYYYKQTLGKSMSALSVRCVYDSTAQPGNLPAVKDSFPVSIFCNANPGRCGNLVDSRDGKSYKWTTIGTQTWFAENLNYNPKASTNSTYACFRGREELCVDYGRQYTWDEAQTACPTGWHTPSQPDWDKLLTWVGGEDNFYKACAPRYYDTTGFNAQPAPRMPFGTTFTISTTVMDLTGAAWWSSTADTTQASYGLLESYGITTGNFYRATKASKSETHTIRCVKD